MASPPQSSEPVPGSLAAESTLQNPSAGAGPRRQRASSAGRLLESESRRPTRGPSLRRVQDSRETLRSRTTRARGGSNGNIDTSSAGQSFTVGNINNGIIYLRPTVRPGHQRVRPAPDPFVILPATPPDSANTTYSQTSHARDKVGRPALQTETKTIISQPPSAQHRPLAGAPRNSTAQRPLFKRGHSRSHSFSTVENPTSSLGDPGTYKVVIERTDSQRPKTTENSMLKVPIPSYRLGTPQFSSNGSAILRSSVFTRASDADDLGPSSAPHDRRDESGIFATPLNFDPKHASNTQLVPSTSTTRSSGQTSEIARLYDEFARNPNDPTHIRFNEHGVFLGATPPRLVAELTSPEFLDYDMLSDFFLTYRAFMSKMMLVSYMISRLRWAIDQGTLDGEVVRVRTFVALRHWILNYFTDDFFPDHGLRERFCALVNQLYTVLDARNDTNKSNINIVKQLKKCWIQACSTYWDPATVGGLLPSDEIHPGGQSVSVLPKFSIQTQASRFQKPSSSSVNSKPEPSKLKDDTLTAKNMDWFRQPVHTHQHSVSNSVPLSSEMDEGARPLSPASETSMQIGSCSIPMRPFNRPELGSEIQLYPHPVPASVAPSQMHSTIGRRQGHKRSGSFSDTMRDVRPRQGANAAGQDGSMSPVLIQPGSLVRGAVYQPASPYIDVTLSQNVNSPSNLDLDLAALHVAYNHGRLNNGSIKNFFSNVRRALSTKPFHSTPSGTDTSSMMTRQSNHHGTTSARSPGTISQHGSQKQKKVNRGKPEVRIDALSAKVGESFKRAIVEEIELEKSGRNSLLVANLGGLEPAIRHSLNLNPDISTKSAGYGRFNSGVTAGSRSILIVDDTGAPPLPVMSGALAASETARPSTHNFSRPLTSKSTITEQGPSANPPEDTAHNPTRSLSFQGKATETTSTLQDLSGHPPPGHHRQASWKTVSTFASGYGFPHSKFRREQSSGSMGPPPSLRRYASFQSGFSRAQLGTRGGSIRNTTISQVPTESSNNDPFQYEKAPVHRLRRRPGGNLRAADNVNDLEHVPRRRHSFSSMSLRTESVVLSPPVGRSIIFAPEESNAGPEETRHSEGGRPSRRRLSLVETHSSQPNMRPSFEAEVAKLAALPDDEYDDGGIESALLKLEGKFEKRSPPTREISPEPVIGAPASSPVPSTLNLAQDQARESTPKVNSPSSTQTQTYATSQRSQPSLASRRLGTAQSVAESDGSYSSTPLLERGHSGMTGISHQHHHNGASISTSEHVQPPTISEPVRNTLKLRSPDSSIEHISTTESMRRIPVGLTSPLPTPGHSSFLLEDDQEFSEHSSDVAADFYEDSDGSSNRVQSFFDDEPAEIDNDIVHPLRHPPTPPATMEKARQRTPPASPNPVNRADLQKGPPTPTMTPPHSGMDHKFSQPVGRISADTALQPTTTGLDSGNGKKLAHLPFIMAYSSEVLAQQFTIVEKDAMDEIDWKELLDIKWKSTSPQVDDWVQYLRTAEPHGIEIAIARFNLMVKWCLSEILLVEDMEERAKAIAKFIRIASHCRRIKNYGTMYQIIAALYSSDCSRLRKTWALVPSHDKKVFDNLCQVAVPTSNFAFLREEMETATFDSGCIPFIGLFTKDLTSNASSPLYITSPPANGPSRIVNFVRHHHAATIVKSLLRLLEASSKYTFVPDPSIISKCLWVAALAPDEIFQASRKCEP